MADHVDKKQIVDEISSGRAYLHPGYRHNLKDWHAIYDQAIDDYAEKLCLELMAFIVKNTTGHSIDEQGNVQFKYKGEWISKEQLFENFL